MAMAFDVANLSYNLISNEANFDFERTDPFSLSCWLFPTATGIGANWQSILGKLEAATFRGWELLRVGSIPNQNGVTDAFRFQLISTLTVNNILVDSQTAISNNVWTHVIVTYDGSSDASGVAYYYNGAAIAALTSLNNLSATILNNTSPTMAARITVDNNYTGAMDDMRVYNRVLSLAEIQTIYAANGPDGIWNGLVARWMLNEKQSGATASGAGTAIDLGAQRNNATPTNSPVYSESQKIWRRRVG